MNMAVLQRACETTGPEACSCRPLALTACVAPQPRNSSHFHVTTGTKHAADNAHKSTVLGAVSASLPPAAGRGSCRRAAGRGGGRRGRCAPQLERYRLTDLVAALHPHVTWRVPSAARSRQVENQPPRGPERAFATGGSAFDAMAAPQEGGGRGKRSKIMRE
jgi:hypothetical protein